MRYWKGLCALFLALAAGLACNGSVPPTATPYQIVIIAPNESPVPTPTPLPTATPTDTPTITPTATATSLPTATPTITPTPTITLTPSQTFTPSITPTPQPIDSAVCQTCQPNLRESPGTSGKIMTRLDETYQFTAVGRTEDNKWLQVVLKNDKASRQGWLFRDLTALREVDVSVLPVTGSAIDATEPPPMAAGAAAPVSGITSKSREIFLRGEQLGNRPYVFTRVGDSITASPYFLTSCGPSSDLGSYHNQLYEVVRYFGGSFTHASLAAGNGWGADRILQPGYNAPDVCGSDSPLVCEYRITKPAVALIMIGTNDSGGVEPGTYEGNLRRIVEISIEMGVVPVLSTIPPKRNDGWNAQRAEQWNDIIRMVARQYDIPLSDYWLALQSTPNLGLSADGIHPSNPPDGSTCTFTPDSLQYGYTVRNLTALQILNAVWRNVLY